MKEILALTAAICFLVALGYFKNRSIRRAVGYMTVSFLLMYFSQTDLSFLEAYLPFLKGE